MNILSEFFTTKESAIWGLAYVGTLMISLYQGGADIYEYRTPYQNPPAFCRAYFNGELR